MPILLRIRKILSGGSLLTILTIIGVIIGIGLGLGLRSAKDDWSQREVMYLKLPGDIFLRTLSALILPLIVCSLVSAIGSLDLGLSKKIGTRALVYYLSTTAFAAILGLALAIIIRPGFKSNSDPPNGCESSNSSTVDTLLDLLRNIFPPNLVGAAVQNTLTTVKSNDSIPFNKREVVVGMQDGTNLMGLVVFAMVLGITLGQMKTAGKPVLDFFTSFGEATMAMTTKVVWTSPVAICFLVAGQLVDSDDIASIFKNIGWYFGTVLVGLLIHGMIVLPLIFYIFTRTMPFTFIRNIFQALATAFGTASSSASLPVTLQCLEDVIGVDRRVTRFVIPIGATVNMNGTALYLPVGAIYIAQLCGRTLNVGELISVSLISIATSIGAAGIPQIGMVIMITVLASVGLNTDHIAYIMPIDWLLERFRTVVNVLGDSIGAGIVAHMSKDDLAKIPLDDTFSKKNINSEDQNQNDLEVVTTMKD